LEQGRPDSKEKGGAEAGEGHSEDFAHSGQVARAQAPEGGEHTFRFAANRKTGLGKESRLGHLAVFGNKFVLSPPGGSH
jgi:hypothetical protein